MAISKITKQIVHGQVISGMKARWLKLKADKEAAQTEIVKITAQMATLKTQYEALIKDIPEPPVEPVE